mmetsp:Transcript_34473/g.61997  ORF Transcript_34473/g.61997 Transcript_34473/m.61997 type:complete len:390 (-) Transcript_34473:72-1241(-)
MTALAKNELYSRSTPRRVKCNIIPILSILCILVSSVNIFLMAKMFLLEKHGHVTADERLQSGSLATIHTRPQPLKNIPANSQSMKEKYVANTKPSLGSSWTSPHLVDCRKVAKAMAKEEETGMFMPINANTLPFSGARNKFFLMNIHNPLKDTVSYKIFKEGCFECDHLAIMLSAFSKYPDSYLLDIGGNIGMWSLVAAAANHQTFTIEPFVKNYQRICKSVDKNSFYDQVHLINIAATSQNTTFRIDVPSKNKGGGRVEAVENADNIDDEYIVQGVPIDSLKLPTDRPILMKVDVEGHELQALIGGIDFLQHANIVYAMTELRPTFQSDSKTFSSWNKIFGILTSKGLQPYRIDDDNETKLNVNRLHEWRHIKHPSVRYFDVVWRKDD